MARKRTALAAFKLKRGPYYRRSAQCAKRRYRSLGREESRKCWHEYTGADEGGDQDLLIEEELPLLERELGTQIGNIATHGGLELRKNGCYIGIASSFCCEPSDIGVNGLSVFCAELPQATTGPSCLLLSHFN